MTRSTQGSDPDRALSDSQDSIVAPVATQSLPRPGATLRLRHSLAARISALVLLVLLAAGASASVAVGQLRELQRGFDLLDVYVDFTPRLAKARVQAQRIGVQVDNWQKNEGEPTATFEANFRTALLARNEAIEEAVATIDGALDDPGRFGATGPVEELHRIRLTLEALQMLATLDEDDDPRAVLQDVRTQSQIVQLFRTLDAQSTESIEQLQRQLQAAQQRTERLTLAFTLVVSALGVLATVGVFFTLRPLRRLTEGVRLLGRGDWSQRISPSGPGREDEVSQLAREFNSMAGALEERERRLLRGERLAAAGQLAAQITHEIRNPLSSVALNAELLEDELSEASPEARELLAKISREVDRLTAVTEDYLSFARRPKPDRSELDLVDELRDLLDFMAPELEMAGIDVRRRLPPGPVPVLGDANQLRQVFMNLVRNAQEAALDEECDRGPDGERQPRIEVEMRCKDDQVFVVVADDGPGIGLSGDDVDRIFDAFYTSKAQGTGLGLPTVQQIVQDHDGAVRVAHTGPQGTAFEVRLPACAPDGGSVSSPTPVAPSGDLIE
ncbi:MAG: HAMP domain-containing sensor histidine kinase [Nannocystaceae bacterium]